MAHLTRCLAPLAAATLLAALGSALYGVARPAIDSTWTLRPPAPALEGRPERLPGAEQSACAECHLSIVDEWAKTSHALAWEDEVYQDDLADRKKAESCHGCHAPTPLMQQEDVGAKPKARAGDRHFGVSCESCHLGPGDVLLGPTGAATDAHATARSDHFIGAGSNALCASCHKVTVGPVIGIAKDFLSSELATSGASCVECHFAPLHPETPPAPGERVVRSHEIQTPRDPSFLAQCFDLSIERSGEDARLVIRNRAGHRVPGLIGRKFEFKASVVDAAGKELSKASVEFDTSSYLPLGESATLDLGRGGQRVKVEALRHDERQKQPATFLERELEL